MHVPSSLSEICGPRFLARSSISLFSPTSAPVTILQIAICKLSNGPPPSFTQHPTRFSDLCAATSHHGDEGINRPNRHFSDKALHGTDILALAALESYHPEQAPRKSSLSRSPWELCFLRQSQLFIPELFINGRPLCATRKGKWICNLRGQCKYWSKRLLITEA